MDSGDSINNPCINRTNASVMGSIAVIGRGPYGVAMFDALATRGVDVVMGIRMDNDAVKHGHHVTLIHPDSTITRRLSKKESSSQNRVKCVAEAIAYADTIVLSIPATAHEAFVTRNADLLRARGLEKLKQTGMGLVLIDTSNPTHKYNDEESVAERLSMLLTDEDLCGGDFECVSVTKAFNTVSAYSLSASASLKGSSDAAPVCGDNEKANALAIGIGTIIGLRPFEIGNLNCARDIEYLGFSFFPRWGTAIAITAISFSVCLLYLLLWYYILDFPELGRPAYKWTQPSVALNKATANTSLILLVLTYLPGKLANLLQLYRTSARKLFPRWLSAWLQIRKQIGLMSCWVMFLHAELTSYLKGGSYGYNTPFGNDFDGTNAYMTMCAELVLVLGVLACAFLIPILLSSLPSVSMSMTWMEWAFLQRVVGHVSLLVAGLHVGLYAFTLFVCPDVNPSTDTSNSPTDSATDTPTHSVSIQQRRHCTYVVPVLSSYPGYLPPLSSVSACLALLTCVLWMFLSIPAVQRRTAAIRKGHSNHASQLAESILVPQSNSPNGPSTNQKSKNSNGRKRAKVVDKVSAASASQEKTECTSYGHSLKGCSIDEQAIICEQDDLVVDVYHDTDPLADSKPEIPTAGNVYRTAMSSGVVSADVTKTPKHRRDHEEPAEPVTPLHCAPPRYTQTPRTDELTSTTVNVSPVKSLAELDTDTAQPQSQDRLRIHCVDVESVDE
ncbi:hypothetical protein SARC_11034 [Sphaeroforma arctica JP610]|uniref:Pyrroline-5-carboxylate reductase catalytic N-terminal domain-containing protein n=1 Tax=Sphaeroforma arctica JP610 TaxID=667725 RepID=A0A0L0FJ22_9EUKA|nr:hypothetical protein SARC_11034 [Sphaeroforma arctica JP610]KNC76466.1 hypothetical protein SARC_11034 [Sphaeroforma arctica JP610]|eukprot:XP_014150368.1 hypothetical protein SARC_11034 [Sphaeroforma arctica JP610]